MSTERRVSRYVHVANSLVAIFALSLFTNVSMGSNLLHAVFLFYLLPLAIIACAIAALIQTSVHSGIFRGRELALALLIPTSCLLLFNFMLAPSFFSHLKHMAYLEEIDHALEEKLNRTPKGYKKSNWQEAKNTILHTAKQALSPEYSEKSNLRAFRDFLESQPGSAKDHAFLFECLEKMQAASDKSGIFFFKNYYQISNELGILSEENKHILQTKHQELKTSGKLDQKRIKKVFIKHTSLSP